jgi:hypothetical protein
MTAGVDYRNGGFALDLRTCIFAGGHNFEDVIRSQARSSAHFIFSNECCDDRDTRRRLN